PLPMPEFPRPGIDEICSLLPPRLARRLLAISEKRGWTFQRGMQVNSQSISGFLRLWLIAKLRPRRPKTYRYEEEQRAIEAWLALIVEAAHLSADLALQITECPRPIQGHCHPHKHGT